MHLYRLARRFPDVRDYYTAIHWSNDFEAEMLALAAAMGNPGGGLAWLNRVIHRGMKSRYYLKCWERRARREAIERERRVTLDLTLFR